MGNLKHLDVALERGLLQEAPGENLLCFRHAEIQQVLYSDMAPSVAGCCTTRLVKPWRVYFPPESERIVEKLAYHFGEAKNLREPWLSYPGCPAGANGFCR